MRVCNLASGSAGNCTYVEGDKTKILVDCGLTINDLSARLGMLGVTIDDIDAVVISHEHIDHIRSLATLSKKYNKKIYAYVDEWQAILAKQKNVNPTIPYVLSIIYMISYPLSSIISGFAYLTLGLNFIIGILIVFKEKINEYYKMLLLFLLDFAIIFTYYYFAPIIYLAVFVQIIAEIISSYVVYKDKNVTNNFNDTMIKKIKEIENFHQRIEKSNFEKYCKPFMIKEKSEYKNRKKVYIKE